MLSNKRLGFFGLHTQFEIHEAPKLVGECTQGSVRESTSNVRKVPHYGPWPRSWWQLARLPLTKKSMEKTIQQHYQHRHGCCEYKLKIKITPRIILLPQPKPSPGEHHGNPLLAVLASKPAKLLVLELQAPCTGNISSADQPAKSFISWIITLPFRLTILYKKQLWASLQTLPSPE